MMSMTHAAISAAAVAVGLGTANPFILLTGALASQLPDIDSTRSIAGRLVYPIASWLEQRYPHRGPTHSFISTGITAIVFLPVFYYFGWQYWAAIVIGQFVGWFSDCFTKSGTQAFWPQDVWLVIPGNPKARLNTRSPAEYWILSTAIVLTIVSVNIASAGGLTEQFASLLFRNSQAAVDTFQKYGNSEYIYVNVEGSNTATGQKVNDRFEIIDTIGSSLLGELEGQLYKIGESSDAQIHALKVSIQHGNPVRITTFQSLPEEEPIEDWLKTLPPGAYLSGTLIIDDASEIRITSPLAQYPTVQATGGGVILSNARPQEVAQVLQDFWIISGNVLVKERT
ncbi:MAG: metal-dependent hydrolase [Prochlorotrichaceae cyanobacterium]